LRRRSKRPVTATIAVGLLMSTLAGCATTPAHGIATTRTGSGNPARPSCDSNCTEPKPDSARPAEKAPLVAVQPSLHLGWPVWIGVVCDDLQAQRRFYRDILGMREWDVGEGWIWFELDGKLFELLARSQRPQYAQRGVTVGFLVDDIQAARAILIQRGVEAVGEIEGEPTSSWAYFKDGQGTLFEIVQKRGAKPPPPASSAHGAAESHSQP